MPGLVVGVLMAAGLAQLAQAILGVNVFTPLSYAAVALLQSTIVALACLAPAPRAACVDPLLAAFPCPASGGA